MIRFNITDSVDQKFSTSINGRRVTFRFRYNNNVGAWCFDLALDGDYVRHGHIVTQNIDMLRNFDFGIGSIFAFSETGTALNRDTLISGAVGIYHVSEEELNASMA